MPLPIHEKLVSVEVFYRDLGESRRWGITGQVSPVVFSNSQVRQCVLWIDTFENGIVIKSRVIDHWKDLRASSWFGFEFAAGGDWELPAEGHAIALRAVAIEGDEAVDPENPGWRQVAVYTSARFTVER